MESQGLKSTWGSISATRVGVSIVGAVGGFISMEHGFFEILQGNVPTEGLMIDAIGPAHELWEGATESAFTIIPNFLITGIFAMIFGILGIIWAVAFVERPYGSLALFVLSITQFLVGGGIAFLIIAIINSMVATRINQPLQLWRKLLPVNLRRLLAKIWLFPLLSFVVLFAITIAIAILGVASLDATSTINLAFTLGYITLGLYLLSIITGFSYDIQKQTNFA